MYADFHRAGIPSRHKIHHAAAPRTHRRSTALGRIETAPAPWIHAPDRWVKPVMNPSGRSPPPRLMTRTESGADLETIQAMKPAPLGDNLRRQRSPSCVALHAAGTHAAA